MILLEKKKKSNVFYLVELALLFAIIIVLTMLPIKIGTIEMSLCMIPVVLGGVVMGPAAGAILGGFFGLCSFSQCFGLLAPSAFGAFILGISPVLTAIICFVPRIIMGYLSALIFKTLYSKGKVRIISYIAANLSGAVLNTVLFTGAVVLFFFGNEKFVAQMQTWGLNTNSVWVFVAAFVALNGIIEAIVCSTLGTAVSKGVHTALLKMHKINN